VSQRGTVSCIAWWVGWRVLHSVDLWCHQFWAGCEAWPLLTLQALRPHESKTEGYVWNHYTFLQVLTIVCWNFSWCTCFFLYMVKNALTAAYLVKFSHSLWGHKYSSFKSVLPLTPITCSNFEQLHVDQNFQDQISKSAGRNTLSSLYKMQFLPCQLHCKSTWGADVLVRTGRQLVVFNPQLINRERGQVRWAKTMYVTKKSPKSEVQDDIFTLFPVPLCLFPLYYCHQCHLTMTVP
jgi:hypothetical protein